MSDGREFLGKLAESVAAMSIRQKRLNREVVQVCYQHALSENGANETARVSDLAVNELLEAWADADLKMDRRRLADDLFSRVAK